MNPGVKREKKGIRTVTMRTIYRAVIILLVVFSAGGLSACRRDVDRRLEDLVSMEDPAYTGRQIDDDRVVELRRDIERYERRIEEMVNAYEQVSVFQRMLASAFIEREMYGPALEALERAVFIAPENPILSYLAGVAAGRSARSALEPAESDRLTAASERYYRRAIELDPGYVDALYGLSVLYLFELDRPTDALPLLARILERSRDHVEARFLLARAYVMTGRVEEAAEVYDEIARTARDSTIRDQALRNRRELTEGVR